MTFKEQTEKDLREVFHNTDEFAEELEFIYNGEKYSAPVIFDERAEPRSRTVDDHVEGIYNIDAVLYITYESIDFIPRQGADIEVKGEFYKIDKVRREFGEYVLEMSRYDE